MTNELHNHPLNGIKLDALLNELVDHYGWDILAAQIPINCFTSYPSVKSSLKFLRKTVWARQRLEAFYLYRYCQYPKPSDEQHKLPPRERLIDLTSGLGKPAVLSIDDAEFFDDPESGPLFPSKQAVFATQKAGKRHRKSSSSLDYGAAPAEAAESVAAQPNEAKQADLLIEPELLIEPAAKQPAKRKRQTNKKDVESEPAPAVKSEKAAHNPWAKALDKLGESDASN